MEPDWCTSHLCVDLNAAATSHAQVMGVMAGFVVAAIAVVLERPRPLGSGDRASGGNGADGIEKEGLGDSSSQRSHDGIPALFVALIAFVVAAFLYGLAGGAEVKDAAPGDSGAAAGAQRVAAMMLAAGLPGCAAVSALGCGLLGLLLDSAHWRLTSRAAPYISLAVPAATGLYVFVSAKDVLEVSVASRPYTLVTYAFGLFLSLVLLVVAAALLPTVRSRGPLNGLRRLLTHRPGFGEALLGFASMGIVAAGISYFLVLLYIPAAADVALLVPIWVGVWVAYACAFIYTSAGMVGRQAPS
jgi:MFS family permease